MEIISFLADLAAVVGALISVLVYYDTVSRDRKASTIDHYAELRDKYPQLIEEFTEEQKFAYLKDLEFFCTGINEGIYDLRVLKRMCGKRLIRQYDNVMHAYIEQRRQQSATGKKAWVEYEKTILRLKKFYR